MSNTPEQPNPNSNPLTSSYYMRTQPVKLVRGLAGSRVLVAIQNIHEYPDLDLRNSTAHMIDQSLNAVDVDLHDKPSFVAGQRPLGEAIEYIKQREATMLSNDFANPKFASNVRGAEFELSFICDRDKSWTLFDGTNPVLYAGYKDETYDDEWSYYWDMDREPTAAETYHSPRLAYMIGSEILGKDTALARDAVASLFAVIEQRQHMRKGQLTHCYAGKGPFGQPHQESYFKTYTFGTVPQIAFAAALGELSLQFDVQPTTDGY